jgi:hypothetical protein
MDFSIKRRDEERAAKFHKAQRDERVNDKMKDPASLLGDERGCVTMHCPHGSMVGYVRVEDARRFVTKGWAYVLTTSDCVEYEGCACADAKRADYPSDLVVF